MIISAAPHPLTTSEEENGSPTQPSSSLGSISFTQIITSNMNKKYAWPGAVQWYLLRLSSTA
jgi:hypothetical protein